ncbi:hypothetical protein GV829_06470 [Sphingomonas lacunae]|uniref:Uncharacterized protein n=1 Tax=Sphingomonas lacunae TaxID=2698828 RepID=A0A6M4AV18_9SPHN|nr:hypothetical protein [Sphingomonas lacunae]QJQ32142.1 hypothetical protein GV829_06470 [Sphingomonas lacunae]
MTATLHRAVANAVRRDIHRVDCSATLKLDIPPALADRFGGATRLSADILYSVQFSDEQRSPVYTAKGQERLTEAILSALAPGNGTRSAAAVPMPISPTVPPAVDGMILGNVPEDDDGHPTTAANARTLAYAFYDALSRGDGVSANQLIVPEKRSRAAFRAANLSRFYGTLREPLRIESIRPIDNDHAQVGYSYAAGASRCQGNAVVTTTVIGTERLIESIQTGGGC